MYNLFKITTAICACCTLSNPAAAGNEQDSQNVLSGRQSKSKAIKHLENKVLINDSRFNSCRSCLVVTIKEVRSHVGYWYHGDKAKTDLVVAIDDVIKDDTITEAMFTAKPDTGFRKGAIVTFVLDETGTSLIPFKFEELIGRRMVWCFDWWRISKGNYHLDRLLDPFHNRDFSDNDVNQLKRELSH